MADTSTAATFGEDSSRTRVKPTHFARFRSFAINILRANGVQNIARELYQLAMGQMGRDSQVDTVGLVFDRLAGTQVVPVVDDEHG